MKTILLALAAIVVVSFYSCDGNQGNDTSEQIPPSLADTHWVAESVIYGVYDEGRREPLNEYEKYELIFTSDDEVTLHLTNKYPDREENLTVSGTYEYDRPEIVFFGLQIDTKHELSQLGMLDGEDGPPSTVTGEDTMIVQMFTGGDILLSIEFRKQEPQP